MKNILKFLISKLTFRIGFIVMGIALVEYIVLFSASIACSGYSYIPSFLMLIVFVWLFTTVLGGFILICAIIRKINDIIKIRTMQ